MSHDKSQKTHLLAQIHLLLSASAQYKRVRYNLKLPSCVWFRPETKAIMWLATLLTPVVAGRKYIPLQSLVPVTTFRCHFFVSHPAYPSFWGLEATELGQTVYLTSPINRQARRLRSPTLLLGPRKSVLLLSGHTLYLWSGFEAGSSVTSPPAYKCLKLRVLRELIKFNSLPFILHQA